MLNFTLYHNNYTIIVLTVTTFAATPYLACGCYKDLFLLCRCDQRHPTYGLKLIVFLKLLLNQFNQGLDEIIFHFREQLKQFMF